MGQFLFKPKKRITAAAARRWEQIRLMNEWNQTHRAGELVEYAGEGGLTFRTRTRSRAWLLADSVAVIELEGWTASIPLDRVRAIVAPEARHAAQD